MIKKKNVVWSCPGFLIDRVVFVMLMKFLRKCLLLNFGYPTSFIPLILVLDILTQYIQKTLLGKIFFISK